jgi:MoaA/NifB/PqqE/SkfB family radical SAM enzyme
MDFELFKEIIGECKRYKRLKMMNFHKDGESLLHPQIYDMIRHAKENKIAEILHMNTNGLLLDESHYEDFFNSGIDDVTISIDASRDATFKKLKGVDALEKIESNIEGLFRYRKEKKYAKPFIRVKIMEFSDVASGEINEFIDRWKGIADDVQVTGIHDWSGAIKGLKVTDETKPNRYPCILLWYALAVNWDGKVSACNVDWDLSALVGDLSKNTLHEIWRGDRIKQLRRAEVLGTKRPARVCEKCVVWAGGDDMTDWFLQNKEFYI